MSSLPVAAVLPELLTALDCAPQVLLSAPTGAGKSTWLPLQLLAHPGINGKIILLEPRRLAARNVAQRLAELLNEKPGDTVGYRMRAQNCVGPNTRLEVVTEGVLTRMIQRDPELSGVGLVILDEFHERSLQADLALALLLDVQQGLRDDLKLLIMSATLDNDRLQQMLPEAELLPVLQIIPIALSIPHVFRNLSVLLWSVHLFHNSDDLLFSYSEDSPSVLWQPPSAYQVLSSVLLLLPHLSPENTR